MQQPSKYIGKYVGLDKDTLPLLDNIARKRGVGLSVVIRWAIDEYLASLASDDSNNRIEQSAVAELKPIHIKSLAELR